MRFTMTITVAVLAGSAVWADVYVENYNWLQLPAGDVTVLRGNSNGEFTGTNGNGVPADFRWGNWVWIPSGSQTQTTFHEGQDGGGDYYSNGMYWAAVKLDQPRQITAVGVQWWAGEGTSITKYYIDGSNDGVNWTELASHEYVNASGERVATTGSRFGLYGNSALAIPSGNVDLYQYVRVRVMEEDYTYGSAGRGGPGLLAIEPMGGGFLAEEKVNWVNQQFGTAVTASDTLHWKSGTLNSGYLYDDEGKRTGDGEWPGEAGAKPWNDPDMYITINLGAARTINELVAVWDADYSASSFLLEYRGDDNEYHPVEGTAFSRANVGITSVTFDDVEAQYWRISDVVSSSSNPNRLVLFNQIMMYGPPVPPIPEPATMTLLALGGLAVLRRRKRNT